MKNILFINASDIKGGAARGGYKIYKSITESGFNTRLFTANKNLNDERIINIRYNIIIKYFDKLLNYISLLTGLQNLIYASTNLIFKNDFFKIADIIQLFLTHTYFNISKLPVLSKNKVVVWRMSDMWAVTGHCSYSYECEKWKTGCGKCPNLKEFPPLLFDTTKLLWKIKKSIYKKSRLIIVAPSLWMKNIIEQSPLLGHFPVYYIPNGVELDIFKPKDKSKIKKKLGIPLNKKIILFSAYGVDNPRKGGNILLEVLNKFNEKEKKKLYLLIVGKNSGTWGKQIKDIDYLTKDLIFNNEELSDLYNASDLMVYPTLAENLPNGILESISCGVPVVAFNTGGVTDAIDHKKNGFLAKYKDADDFFYGIKFILKKQENSKSLMKNCRYKAEKEFSINLQNKRFIDLYNSI